MSASAARTPPADSSRLDRVRAALTDQPVAGGHGRAVVEQRIVADDDGIAVGVSDDDLEGARRGPSKQGGHAAHDQRR